MICKIGSDNYQLVEMKIYLKKKNLTQVTPLESLRKREVLEDYSHSLKNEYYNLIL